MSVSNPGRPALAFAALAAFATLGAAAPAAVAANGVLEADTIVCTPSRMARCDTAGTCKWQEARDRDKERPLVLNFAEKKAFVRSPKGNQNFGLVVEDKLEEGARTVVIKRNAEQPLDRAMHLSVDKDGKLTGQRGGGRIKLEATCEPA